MPAYPGCPRKEAVKRVSYCFGFCFFITIYNIVVCHSKCSRNAVFSVNSSVSKCLLFVHKEDIFEHFICVDEIFHVDVYFPTENEVQ